MRLRLSLLGLGMLDRLAIGREGKGFSDGNGLSSGEDEACTSKLV
jgi:hypothetical protein